MLKREFPDCELVLTRQIREDCAPLLRPYESLITWQESMHHPALATFFQNSDVYVLASIEEGLARTGLEAMACGVPAIVTPHTGVNDYVLEGVNGFVVPIRDPKAIFEKLLFLATNPDARRTMGEAAAVTMLKLQPGDFEQGVVRAMQTIEERRRG